MSLFTELKRRNVFRVAAAYIVVAWLLTEILATILPMFGVPDWVGKAVVIVAAVTFVPVLVFAWAFEMTPEGIKREKDVNRDSSITSRTGKKLDYVTIAAVVVGVGLLGWSKLGTEIPEPAIEITETSGAPSVAVLPFVNMSGNAENEYFSDGLTETLLHMLSQVPNIKVAARTSSFAFKGKEQDVRQIALALGVAHILEGSVQRSGDKVRVTAQLIRADDGFHVWSSNYDRTLNDIFAIQDEIAADVGKSLTTSLLGASSISIESVGTHDIIAYDLYLQALSEKANNSYEGLQQAEHLLKQSLLIDPDFLDAKSALGMVYIFQESTGFREEDEAFANAAELFKQVVSVRPRDATARAATIVIRARMAENDGAYMAVMDAIPEIEAIVETAPNDVDLRILVANVLRNTDRHEDAQGHLQKALLIDPVNSELHYTLGMVQKGLRDWDSARASIGRSLELNPDNPNAHGQLAEIGYASGDPVGAVDNVFKAMAIDPKDHELASALARYCYRLGLLEYGDKYRDRALLISRNAPASQLAVLIGAFVRGDREYSDEIARSMVSNNVEERHGSFFWSVLTVLLNAVAREDAAEGLEFVERYHPGFNDPTSSELPWKTRWAQAGAFSAWDAAYGREKAAKMATDYLQLVMMTSADENSLTETRMQVLALQGKTEEAIELALSESMTKPISLAIWWRELYDEPQLQAVVADPRVAARLREWDEDLLKVRADVKAYLDGTR